MVYEPVGHTAFRFRGHFIDAGVLYDEAQSSTGTHGDIHERCVSASNLRHHAKNLWNDRRGKPDGYSAHEIWSPEKRRQVIRSVAYSLWRLRGQGMQIPDACFYQKKPPLGYLIEDDEFNEDGW